MAEAHITSDDPTNPLLPGDRIYSQVWDRGRQVGFGIAGFIDMDERPARAIWTSSRAIIAASGGVVDAAPDDDGRQAGRAEGRARGT